MLVVVLVLLILTLSAFVWVSMLRAPGIAGTVSVDDIAVRVRVYWPSRVLRRECRLLLPVVRGRARHAGRRGRLPRRLPEDRTGSGGGPGEEELIEPPRG